MHSAEKQLPSAESQFVTEASRWLQKDLLDQSALSLFHPQGLCYTRGLDTNAQKDSAKPNTFLSLAVS